MVKYRSFFDYHSLINFRYILYAIEFGGMQTHGAKAVRRLPELKHNLQKLGQRSTLGATQKGTQAVRPLAT